MGGSDWEEGISFFNQGKIFGGEIKICAGFVFISYSKELSGLLTKTSVLLSVIETMLLVAGPEL